MIKVSSLTLGLYIILAGWTSTWANTAYQTGTLAALMSGAYVGSVTYKELNQHGDFGLGTGNGIAGEMTQIDGKIYLANDSAGNASMASSSMKTPFAMTTNFKAEKKFHIKDVKDINKLDKILNQYLPSQNIYYAIKITGTFNLIKARSILPAKNADKNLRLATLIKKYQRINNYRNIKATLIIFRSPEFSSPISLAGNHIHFINDKKNKAGHVYDVSIKQATVEIDPLYSLYLQLPTNKSYLNAKIDIKDSSLIAKTEHHGK